MKNHWFWGQTKNFAKSTINFVEDLSNQGLSTFSGKVAFRQFHFLLHPEPIIEVSQKKDKYFKKSFAYQGVEDFLGKGLLTNEGQDWLEKRRIIQPSFSKKSIESLTNLIENCTREFLEKNKGKKLNLQSFMTELITEIISQIFFSESEISMKGEGLMDLLLDLRTHANNKLKNPFKHPLFIPTKSNQHFKQSRQQIWTYIESQVNRRISSKQKKEDVLQWLCDLQALNPDQLTTLQLVDELITLYVAGQETTSNALTFLVHQIEQHPEVKSRILESDEYLNAVIKEGLRLYPPVWAISREALQDVEIGDLLVSKGDTVFISIYAMHRHKDYWENPESFNPDRFLEKGVNKNPAYLPFGKGSRFCIGNHLANLEMMIVLKQLYRFNLECEETDLELITPMTLGLKNSISFNYS